MLSWRSPVRLFPSIPSFSLISSRIESLFHSLKMGTRWLAHMPWAIRNREHRSQCQLTGALLLSGQRDRRGCVGLHSNDRNLDHRFAGATGSPGSAYSNQRSSDLSRLGEVFRNCSPKRRKRGEVRYGECYVSRNIGDKTSDCSRSQNFGIISIIIDFTQGTRSVRPKS